MPIGSSPNDPFRYRRLVEEANWRYYREIADDEAEGNDDEAQAGAVRSAADVWPLLSRPRLTVPAQTRGWTVVLSWECAWGREHGHAVVLHNGKVKYVGQQGGVW